MKSFITAVFVIGILAASVSYVYLYYSNSSKTQNLEVIEPKFTEPLKTSSCEDGTPYNSCASKQPLFCNEGQLINDCQKCGCFGSQQVCSANGTCSVYSHIKVMGSFYGEHLEPETIKFAAEHFDIFNGFWKADIKELRKYTNAPVLVQDDYLTVIYPTKAENYIGSKYESLLKYSEERGLDFEDFFLHYSTDMLVDLADQCNEDANPSCPSCGLDGSCNIACLHSIEGMGKTWSSNWNSRPDPDCTGTDTPLVRGWNPADDLNSDGVRDVDPLSNPNATARYRFESRVPYQWFGKYVVNIRNPELRKFSAEYANKILKAPVDDSGNTYDGVIVQTPGPGFPDVGGAVLEYPKEDNRSPEFRSDFALLLSYTRSVIKDKLQIPNVGVYWIPEYLAVSEGQFQEGTIQDDRTAGIYLIFFNITKQLLNESKLEIKSSVKPNDISDRSQTYSLAVYYLGRTENTYYSYTGSYSDPRKQWFGAMAYDTGRPLRDYQFFESGTDPSGTSSNIPYQIYVREFEKALVIVKFNPWYTSSMGDDSTTAHDLPGNFYPLNANGSLGPLTNRISLRNAEGAILIKEGAVI